MTQIRAARMAEAIREQVSDILQHHLSDPRLSWVSVTRVDLSSDLGHAKVFISVLGSEEQQEKSVRVLHRATGAVRAELARRIRMRKVPELTFHTDRSIEYGARVQEILHELGFDAEHPAGPGAHGTGSAKEEGSE